MLASAMTVAKFVVFLSVASLQASSIAAAPPKKGAHVSPHSPRNRFLKDQVRSVLGRDAAEDALDVNGAASVDVATAQAGAPEDAAAVVPSKASSVAKSAGPSLRHTWMVLIGLAAIALVVSLVAASKRRSEILHVLHEKRTMRLLLVPSLAAIVTLTMTYMNYEEFGVPNDERHYFVSQCVNYPMPESWSAWLARWAFWHLVIFSIVEFKCSFVPWDIQWLPLLWGFAACLVIWSGVHQWDVSGTYCCPVLGIGGAQRFMLHVIGAIVAFFISWIETVCIWWPDRRVHMILGTVTVLFLSWDGAAQMLGFPRLMHKIGNSVLEFGIFAIHILSVWYKAPVVKTQMEEGTWRPWVGCCHWSCPRLEVLPQEEGWRGCCCPPRMPLDASGDLIGDAVTAK